MLVGLVEDAAQQCEVLLRNAVVLVGVTDQEVPPARGQLIGTEPDELDAGRGSGFSVEAPEGVRFLIRSRLM